MTYEEGKTLKAEDFMAPNPVLCYGGGGAFQGVGKYMAACGINLVGVIDKNKKGTVAILDKEFPLLTLDKAAAMYGSRAIVVITIASSEIIRQVKQDLLEHGFSEHRIFDLNIWSWLTVPSEKCYCRLQQNELRFFSNSLSPCCMMSFYDPFDCEWYIHGRPVGESIENFLAKRAYYIEESQKGRVPLYCRNCRFLSPIPDERSETIDLVSVDDSAVCNADCVYCDSGCSAPRERNVVTVQERYAAISYALEDLRRKGILNRKAVIQLAGGEITVNPFKNELYQTIKRLFDWSPDLRLTVYSNCFVYDQEIAGFLSASKSSFLMCDLDAGTPQTYIKVKGFNKFDTVCENLKKYAQCGRLQLKYIILPGWNDAPADCEGIAALLKSLNLRELTLSPEFSVSKEGSREKFREILFAAARWMAFFERNGLQAVLSESFWKKEHIEIARRLCRELQSLEEQEYG